MQTFKHPLEQAVFCVLQASVPSCSVQLDCTTEPHIGCASLLNVVPLCCCVVPVCGSDYVFDERKFGGNAQAITSKRWLHHTSLLWDYDSANMAVLTNPKKQPTYRQVGVLQYMCCHPSSDDDTMAVTSLSRLYKTLQAPLEPSLGHRHCTCTLR